LANVPMVGTLDNAVYCGGTQMIFPFTSPQQAGSNVFTAQLSDTNGSFSNPVDLGTSPGISGGSFLVTLPNNLATSGQYRLRILGSNPSLVGLPSLPFGIRSAAAKPDSITGIQAPCSGAQNVVYSVPANAGADSYNWVVPTGGTLISGQGSNSITVNWTSGGNKILSVSGVNSCGAGPSVIKTVTVKPIENLFATIEGPSSSALCAGQTVNFASTVPANSNLGYQWKVNGNEVANATLPVYVLTNVQNNFSISLSVAAPASSCFVTDSAVSNTLNFTVNPVLPVSPNISSPTNGPYCSGQSITFTSSVVNLGANGTYSWRINGNTFAGNNAASFSRNSFQNGDKVSLVVNSTALCGNPKTVTTDTINLVINPIVNPSVTITSQNNQTTVCSGESINLNANPVQPGTNPNYQWFQNGNAIPNANGATYTTPTSLTGIQNFTVRLTSNALCATPPQVNSASFLLTVVSVASPQTQGDTVCRQGQATLQAIGLGQQFRWYTQAQGGDPITGQNLPTFTSPVLNSSQTYFVSQVISNCEGPRAPVLAFVNPFNNAAFSTAGNPEVLSASPDIAQSFQWLLNGNPIPGAILSTFSISESGNYSVVIGLQGCTDTTAAQFFTYTRINKPQSARGWNVYPIPSKGNVKIEGTGITGFMLFDALGIKVGAGSDENFSNKEQDFSTLPKGMYQMVLFGTGESAVRKLILD